MAELNEVVKRSLAKYENKESTVPTTMGDSENKKSIFERVEKRAAELQ